MLWLQDNRALAMFMTLEWILITWMYGSALVRSFNCNNAEIATLIPTLHKP